MPRSLDEWQGSTDDEAIPRRVRLRIWEQHDRRCATCRRPIGESNPWDCDHIEPLATGGRHAEGNLQPLCRDCHPNKTRNDLRAKSRSARVRSRMAGIQKDRTITAWRRFDGTIVRVGRKR